MTATPGELLADLAGTPDPPAFALLHRRGTADQAAPLDVVAGKVAAVATLADIPLRPAGKAGQAGAWHDVLALLPYRQIGERGFTCVDDGVPLQVITVTRQERVPLAAALAMLPDEPTRMTNGHFDVPDHEYAEIVKKVVADEIGRGEGANFVIKRRYVADIADYSILSALSIFRRLLQAESGSYWTFLVHTGDRILIGASPERHVSLADGTARMNPISGTLRYPPSGPTIDSVERFLADRKEIDELNMVVDEELKMMGRICDAGGRVIGPYLKEMTRLAHTEYHIDGHTSQDPRSILRETMFAPTVTGSPLENACRVITRYEPTGRGYYSGVVALIGRDEEDRQTLDSAITIRTAEIAPGGKLVLGVGATLVRHSEPESEVAETAAKASGLLTAVGDGRQQLATAGAPAGQVPRFANHPTIRAALARRNDTLASFWRTPPADRASASPPLAGFRALVIDAEDTFTSMIAHQLRAAGLLVTVRRFDEDGDFGDYDLTVLGPGPGDPKDPVDPKVARLRAVVRLLLDRRRPFLAVCLSHQVLCGELGLPLLRLPVPNQGTQKTISLFGARERVGFYNAFAASSFSDEISPAGIGPVDVGRDASTAEVHALRGPWFSSYQFHAESILTTDGVRLLAAAARHALSLGPPA